MSEGGKIYGAMLEVMRELKAIGKDQRNQQQGFNYRGVDQVYGELHPLFRKHGIFMSSEVIEKFREERTNNKGTTLIYSRLHMRYWFIAEDGSKVSAEAVGEGMDSGDKASNKAMAVAHKYVLLQVFAIPTEELKQMDPDRESHEVAAKAQNPYGRSGGSQPKSEQSLSDADAQQEFVKGIMEAKDGEALKASFSMAYRWGKGRNDEAAVRSFVAAKEERKRQLDRAA